MFGYLIRKRKREDAIKNSLANEDKTLPLKAVAQLKANSIIQTERDR